MPLDRDALFPQPAGGGHGLGIGGLPFHGFIPAPVEGKGAVIEQPEPFYHTFLQERTLLFIVRFHDLHGIEGAAAEKELMGDLVHVDGTSGGR